MIAKPRKTSNSKAYVQTGLESELGMMLPPKSLVSHLEIAPSEVSLTSEENTLDSSSISESETTPLTMQESDCSKCYWHREFSRRNLFSKESNSHVKNLETTLNDVISYKKLPSQIPRYSPSQCAFEIPVGIKEGSRISLNWPDGNHVVITCPENLDISKPNVIVVVAPGEELPTLKKRKKKNPSTTVVKADKTCSGGKKRKKEDSEEWLWDEYEKKSSRIGRSYQIKYLPKCGRRETMESESAE